MNIQNDLRELKVETGLLEPKYKNLLGTRQIIQYEHPDYVFTLSKTIKPTIECYGITNRCEDGKFVLFLDYDNIYEEIMYKDLDNLLRKYPKILGNFYIATTGFEETDDCQIKGNFHVVNFAKLYKYQIEQILKLCNIDPYFIKIPEKTAHKCHVLRISEKFWKKNGQVQKEKPRFIQKYPEVAINQRLELSNAHYIFFSKEWNIREPFQLQAMKFDKLTKIELHKYSTPKGMVKNEL